MAGILPQIESVFNTLKQRANAAVKPTVDSIQNSPLADTLKGNFGQILPDISQNLNKAGQPFRDQESILTKSKGRKITPAEEKQLTSDSLPMVLGTVGGIDTAPETSAAEPAAAATNNAPAEAPAKPPTLPEIPAQAPLSLRQKIVQKLNGLDNYQLGDEYAGNRPTLENQDKSVMQNVVGGNSAAQVLERSSAAKQATWGKIEGIANNLPAIDVNTKVLPYVKQNIQNLVDQGLITQTAADKLIESETTKIAGNPTFPVDNTTSNPRITGAQLLDLRKGANDIASKGLNSSGGLSDTATTQQIVNKAIANGYKDALTNADPQIASLSQQYSSLKRIGEMPGSFRNQSLNIKTGLPVIGNVPLTGTARRVAAAGLSGDPRIVLPAGIGIGAGVVGAGMTLKDLANNPANEIQNGSQNGYGINGKNNGNNSFQPNQSISKRFPDVKFDNQGHTTVPVNTTTKLMTDSDYETKAAALDKYDPKYQENLADLKRQYDDSVKIRDSVITDKVAPFMRTGADTIALGNVVADDLNKIPTTLLNSFKDWNGAISYAAKSNNPYAQEILDIAAFDRNYQTAYQALTDEKLAPDEKIIINPTDPMNDVENKIQQMQAYVTHYYGSLLPAWDAKTINSGVQDKSGKGIVNPPVSAPTSPNPVVNMGFPKVQLNGSSINSPLLPPIPARQ